MTLKAGSNQIDFGRFAGDWGYMFIKSIKWSLSSTFRLRQTGAAFSKERLCSSISFRKGSQGAAASYPQTEGVTNKRHRSIWDSWFRRTAGAIYQQQAADRV